MPITPHLPSFASMMARTKKLVVVLPFVPVMPTATSDALVAVERRRQSGERGGGVGDNHLRRVLG